MTDQEKINWQLVQDGNDAAFLVGHPAFDAIFRAVGQRYQDEWFSTTSSQKDRREMLWVKLQVLKDIKEMLIAQVNIGRSVEESIQSNRFL